MHPVLFNESFSFCSRDVLERLQPLSQMLLDMIAAGSNVLPLRPIQRVDMAFDATNEIRIFLAKPVVGDDAGDAGPDYKASIRDGDFAEIVRRLQNTCMKDLLVGIRDSPFLCYWKAQETATFTVVNIDFSLNYDTDYGVLDSIVKHLRPRTWHILVY
ncbi:hypothetical protein AAVH_28782 [Aphelenchoides avenae]|nr:hypothetical protein AAVH_28782 [Aphelenchus avenae]